MGLGSRIDGGDNNNYNYEFFLYLLTKFEPGVIELNDYLSDFNVTFDRN